MERNAPVNSVYLIALAVSSLILVIDGVISALIFGIVVLASFLISVCVVSMVEKIADKHIRFLLFALVSASIITILKVTCSYIGVKEIVLAGERLELAILPCLLLAIVPIYFEQKFEAKEFFKNSILIAATTLLLILLLGLFVDVLGNGAFFGIDIKGFDGLEFFTMPYGQLMVIASLSVLFNMVRRAYIKKTRRFNMLVEKYKIQIREIRDTQIRVRAGERGEYNE